MANSLQNDLFSSLISEIKTYTGNDPLLPWLRGIRKMRESLPPQLLKGKLPRFLQKCAQTFETDRRYRNDSRYLRVWIQLLDFVDDPRALLKSMEMKRIGAKLALFYQAYALYYEKLKKFEEAEKMYHLGVQSLAEPANELQKSYEQFLHRMERHKKRKTRRQEGRTAMRPLTARKDVSRVTEKSCSEISFFQAQNNHTNVESKKVVEEISSDMMSGKLNPEAYLLPNHLRALVKSCYVGIGSDSSTKKEVRGSMGPKSSFKQQESPYMESDKPSICNDDTVVVKFVDTAIVGKSEAEDACHHGLVDPTINMKEAMNAINSMFREPLEPEPVDKRRSHRSRPKVDQNVSNGFEVFIDENLDNGVVLPGRKKENSDSFALGLVCPANLTVPMKHSGSETQKPLPELFKIFIDDEGGNEGDDDNDENNNLAYQEVQHSTRDAMLSSPLVNVYEFPSPKDLSSNGSDDLDVESSTSMKFREDTVVCRFVGSTILDEPEVENACHHGLVDPTINLKEAMDDINSMFGKPLDFVKTNRRKKQGKVLDRKRDHDGFSILPDEGLEDQQKARAPLSSSTKLGGEFDLFEPTTFTKEAMAEINEMFGMPLDF